MKTTIESIRTELQGRFAEMELYREAQPNQLDDYQTDSLEPMENGDVDWDMPVDVSYYTLMDEEDYNHTIMANCGDTVDFDTLYDEGHDAKVLVIVLAYGYKETYEEDLDSYINDKSEYFSMKKICELANVNYETYRGYKNKGHSLSTGKKLQIIGAMKKAGI